MNSCYINLSIFSLPLPCFLSFFFFFGCFFKYKNIIAPGEEKEAHKEGNNYLMLLPSAHPWCCLNGLCGLTLLFAQILTQTFFKV